MRLPQEQTTLLPTDEDVRHYREHGWYATPKIFSDEEIDAAMEGGQRHYAGHRDRTMNLRIKKFLDWSPDSDAPLRVNDFIALQNAAIGRIAMKPLLGAVAARLAGADEIRLFNSSLIYKPPHVMGDSVKVGWHVDRAYWQMCTSERMLTAWVPLHDVDERMGSLIVLDGSRNWPNTPLVRALRIDKSFISDDVAALEQRLENAGMEIQMVPIRLRKGQVSFHHCLTFHGSGLNRSDRPRVAIVVHLQDRPNRYQRRLDASGRPYSHNLDTLVRSLPTGEPDYADPDICPVIWSGVS
jgi:hypothetical protein